jgi:transposase
MTATHDVNPTIATTPVLYFSLELGQKNWKLAFTVGLGQKPRLKTIVAGNTDALLAEVKAAKRRFGLPENAAVAACYEAGRDGFWLHRFLLAQKFENLVVDSASIEVNRRKRRAKSDRLDAVKLVEMLIRWCNGERKVWSILRVPAVADEDRRQLHRELIELKAERTAHVNVIKGLLAGLGLHSSVDEDFPKRMETLRQWDGSAVPEALRGRLLREFERWRLVGQQIHELERERIEQIRKGKGPEVEQVRQLLNLKGIGENGACLLVNELFAWRRFQNRRELGSIAGLTPTPYNSGESRREQGISKAGNRRVRWMMVQLSWGWLQYQPESELSQWYQRRFGHGKSRLRKIGIVALARKLLIALWRYLETGETPAGAEVIGWDKKPKFACASEARKAKKAS